MGKKIPITEKGLKRITEERNKLRDEDKPNIIKAISDARDKGDLSENAEYDAAKEQQGMIEARINFLNNIIANAESINPETIEDKNTIVFGATVTLLSLDNDKKVTYQVVGEEEADIDSGLISYTSPLGHALIRKKVGDIIELEAQNKSWEILKIEYK